jgi:hypothetical protein
MIDSKGSVVVGHERAHDRLAGGVVVPDGGGEGEDALQDADGDAVNGPAAVLLEVELAFVMAVVVLVADDDLPGPPCQVVVRCGRRPQNQREWEAQYPYCAHPARSERLTVSRERAHPTGWSPRPRRRRSTGWCRRLGRGRSACSDSGRRAARLLYIVGLPRKIGEQVAHVHPGAPDPAGLGGEPEQCLQHREGVVT